MQTVAQLYIVADFRFVVIAGAAAIAATLGGA